MTKRVGSAYLRALGARILSEANDLKRTPAALAEELHLDAETVDAVIAGRAQFETARALAQAMAETYPVSLAEIWIEPDDTDNGVRLMSAAQSAASSRVFERKDRRGGLSPYYEYRDTAMSATAPFKPEWIAELRQVDDADPDNPDVAYNNGHLLHQTTFFIGPVNFYWKGPGGSHCAVLETGDSNYITPFVPHSFTSRDLERRGLIIAVTYAGEVRRALGDLGRIGSEAADRLAGDLRCQDAFGHRLRRHLEAESLDAEGFAGRLAAAGIPERRTAALLDGGVPTDAERAAMAEALGVRVRDLMVDPLGDDEEVVVRLSRESEPRTYPRGNDPAYRLAPLARSRHQPLLKGFDVAVLGGAGGELAHGLHEYVYNYGDQPVRLAWGEDRGETLGPGDSAYVRPTVRHRFQRPAGAAPGQLAVIRVPGALTDSVLDEYAGFDPEGRSRVIEETKRWF